MLLKDFQDTSLRNKAGIYLLFCTENKKVRTYIGSTKNLYKRILQHYAEVRRKRHTNKFVQRVYNKYGDTAFRVTILEIVENINTLLEKEQQWVNRYSAAGCERLNSSKSVSYFNSEELAKLRLKAIAKSVSIRSKPTPKLIHIFTKEIIESSPSILELSRRLNTDRGKITNYLKGVTLHCNGYVKVGDYPDSNTLPKELPKSPQFLASCEKKKNVKPEVLKKYIERASIPTPKFYNKLTGEIISEQKSRKDLGRLINLCHETVIAICTGKCTTNRTWKIYNPETDY